MKYFRATLSIILVSLMAPCHAKISEKVMLDDDTLTVETVGPKAYRIRITPKGADRKKDMTDQLMYLPKYQYDGPSTCDCSYDPTDGSLIFKDENGKEILCATNCILTPAPIEGIDESWHVRQTFKGPEGESIYGTGQFQDGYLDIKGLSRRLTQVNTQISVPMVISSKGYGILWNNCGLTEYNPGENMVELLPKRQESQAVKVNVTGTEGNKQEERRTETFTNNIYIEQDGDYSLLLDCGQSMSRKHYLEVDGEVLTQADNLWLPPTTSVKVHLTKGSHEIVSVGDKNDSPKLYWRLDDGTTVFDSPVSQGIDYTVMLGSPDEIIAQMRSLTGEVPMLPKWALGYIHCRERYDNQAELLANAQEFRNRDIPIDVIVQDWQWWGKNGWNAMRFDSDKYPDPKAMTDSLHAMDMRIMLSVWAKVDKSSELGRDMEKGGHYIPDTDWIDFFNPESAEAYWTAYRENLLPTGIDAWWQDATEPENDDLYGRTVGGGKISGDAVRNVFPIVVNDRVHRGLCEERPNTRPMILTRCGAPGIQRYGVVTWSGDVGNDCITLDRQLCAGLNQSATGLPWWTYDAGGFFRPWDQYDNAEYLNRMIRWIQTAVFLPLMRVHGYMSQTEPWHYSDDTYDKFLKSINLRYSLLPYIYSEAQRVSEQGYTLMRPLVFDFPEYTRKDNANVEYMFGQNLLVCPISTDADMIRVDFPPTKGGWYDIFDGTHYDESTSNAIVKIPEDHILVFAKAGTILPWIKNTDGILSSTDINSARLPDKAVTLKIFPGADGVFTLYDDDGISNDYQHGQYTKTRITWDDSAKKLDIAAPEGDYPAIQDFNLQIIQ